MPKDDRQKIKNKLISIQPQHPVATFQHSVLKAGGDTVWLQWSIQAIFGNHESITEFFAVARDVSDSTMERHARQLERDNFINILNSMQDGVYIVNREHEIEYINHSLKKAFGPIKGLKCYAYFHDKDDVCEWCKNNEVFSGKTVRWEWYSEKSKKFYDLIDTPLKKPDGSVSKLEIFRDISLLKEAETILQKDKDDLEELVKERTKKLEIANKKLKAEIIERKKAEKLLLVQSKQFEIVLSNLPIIIFILNKDGIITFSDGKGLDAIGKKPGAEIGESPLDPSKRVPHIVENVKRVLQGNEFKVSVETQGRFYETMYSLIIDQDGQVTGAIGCALDNTESRIIEKRLMQSEKLSSLGLLVSGIAHEINNPNNFIILNLPTLKKYIDSMIPIIDEYSKEKPEFEIQGMLYDEFREEVFTIIDDIAYGSKRIDSSITRLKEYIRSRNDSLKQWIDITDIIRKSVSICESEIKKKTTNFDIQIPEILPKVFTDPNAVEQVIINLLINAAQASVKLDAWIKLSAQIIPNEKKMIEISVKDNGCGMDKDTKEKVFDPYFTTKISESGTGLGLYITFNMVEKLGGHITVESEKGIGSSFIVSLPTQ